MTGQNAQPGPESKPDAGGVSRRSLFRAAGVGAAVVGGGSLPKACSSSIKGASGGSRSTSGTSGNKRLTIGWIHPLTGSLAECGAPDNWIISQIKQNDPHNKDEVASSKNPAPGVVITPPVGIQWQKGHHVPARGQGGRQCAAA